MSETNPVSPLLDGFALGNPISEHGGIRCCPAIRENTDKKYIVKIIAVPASQAQMDALLLAGAYKDPSDAMEYFHRQGEDVLKEAQLLKDLSKLSGFLSYEGWQMEPIPRYRLGYEVYLTGSYKRSLERYIRHHAVTHLEAINLGLDMCSALSVCRQAGYLYVDLKPGNIFLSDKKEYRIGDLGFLSMDSLRYATIPEKYLSSYTPPELYDPMASVNLTVDTYALGMILYQLYNDGHLPFQGQAPAEALPSPVQADYELAEIILKAIHPDPEQRYQDPAEMGKALASYMQRNSINDVPITPLRTRKSKKKKKQLPSEDVQQPIEETETPLPETEPETTAEPETVTEETVAVEETPESEVPAEEISEEIVEVEEIEEVPEPEESLPEETEIEDIETEEVEDESVSEEAEESPEEDLELSDELSRILAKADDLIAHETPEPIRIPETEEEDPFAFAQEEEIDDSDVPYDPLMEEDPEAQEVAKKNEKKFIDPKYARRRKKLRNAIITLLALAAIGAGSFWYYQNLFLQAVNALTITGDQTQITVLVDSPVDQDKLTVSCLDANGKGKSQSLIGGQTVFTDLTPNTEYTISVDIAGFHKLTGKTSDVYTTQTTTQILSFTSMAGQENGSVVLDFTVAGTEPSFWTLHYSAEGEEEKTETLTGHSATISGLTLGKRYTFRLDAGDDLSLSGETTLEVLASRLILADHIRVTSGSGDSITVSWDAPGDVVVDSWDVRCYNTASYDQSYTVTNTEVLFTGIDPATGYTVEVTAAGMTQPSRLGISADPIVLTNMDVTDNGKDALEVSWDFTGSAPQDGWLLLYSVDGSGSHVVQADKAGATVSPRIPGAKYEFTLQAADGTTVFNSVQSYTAAEAEPFAANKLTADMLTVDLIPTPSDEKWYCENISDQQITDQFQSGEGISIMLRSSDTFYLPGSETKVLFVIRDAYGNVLPQYTQEQTMVWKNIWTGGDSKNGELNVPALPEYPGEFQLGLYFDGRLVAEVPFTIAQ